MRRAALLVQEKQKSSDAACGASVFVLLPPVTRHAASLHLLMNEWGLINRY
jgi:hypothetical protein